MTWILRHQSRCILLGTSTWNIVITLLASLLVGTVGARSMAMPPTGRIEFEQSSTTVRVRQGGVAILPCSVRHLGTKQVAWRQILDKGQFRFLTIGKLTWVNDENVSLEFSRSHDVSNFNLVLKHVQPSDQGVYECQVTSRKGHTKHVTLKIVGPPISKPDSSLGSSRLASTHGVSNNHNLPTNAPNLSVNVCVEADEKGCLISITGQRYVDLGDKIELQCNASSGVRVADEMDWFKAGDKIDKDKYGHVHIEKFKSMETHSFISMLTIKRSTLKDTGDYICRSSRNDIASLKVTVLHAETENKRRGTEMDRTRPSYQSNSNGPENKSAGSGPSLLLCVLCAVIAAGWSYWKLDFTSRPVVSL